MTFDRFSKIIERLKSHSDRIHAAYALKIDIIDFDDDINRVIDDLIREIYGETGYDWFSWFCYENDYGNKDWKSLPLIGNPRNIDGKIANIGRIKNGKKGVGAWDENGNPICYDVRSTWEFLEKNYSRIQKNQDIDPRIWETIKESGDKINQKKPKK